MDRKVSNILPPIIAGLISVIVNYGGTLMKEEDLENLSNIISMKNTTINNLNLTIKQKEFKIDELDSKIYGIRQTMAI